MPITFLTRKKAPLFSQAIFSDIYQGNNLKAITTAATGGVLWKKVFLKISQNSQENNCARVSFLIKLQVSGLKLY